MSQYIKDYYSRTVLVTNDIEEVKSRADELVKKCIDKDKRFIDPDFGPNSKDPKGELAIFYPPDEAVSVQGDSSVGQYNNVAGLSMDMISWLRPKDFCKDPKKCAFVTEEDSDDEAPKGRGAKPKAKKAQGGASSLDVMQGNLGDCWFISAMALIAIRDDLFSQITCNGAFKSYESKGLYVFKMFKNCRAHYVIIDDRIPCLERARGDYFPAFARCRNPNEFWVSMFEKAYAKLNIRYINLTSGFIDEALQDLTGLAPEMLRFTPSVDVDEFWDNLKDLVYTNSLIGASLNFLGRRDYPEDEKRELQREAKICGIQYGHAYGILDVREIKVDGENYRLLRVKNPWGKENNLEWNGSWGDNDPRWTPDMKKRYNDAGMQIPSKLDKEELVHKFGKNDNIFIMQVDDFVRYFNTLMTVRDFPDEWSGIRYFTRWNPSFGLPPKSKNWASNPGFAFELQKKTEISLRLQQPDPRCYADARPPMKKLVLMFLVFKKDGGPVVFNNANIVLQSAAADSRSVSAEGELNPGTYLVHVFTIAEGVFSDCYLSIYFNCKKTEINFEDKSWEIILEEEEEEEKKVRRPKTQTRMKTLEKKVKAKLDETQEIQVETEDTKDNLEVVIKDHAALELECEVTMCNLFGLNFNDYKNFQNLAKDKQELMADGYSATIGVVDLNDYCLGVRGVSSLISVITDTKELRVLGLKNNQINDQVVLELTRKIGKFKSLEEIDVSQNPEITDRGAAALLFLAGKIPKLRRIDVAGTSVSLDLAHQILSRVNKIE